MWDWVTDYIKSIRDESLNRAKGSFSGPFLIALGVLLLPRILILVASKAPIETRLMFLFTHDAQFDKINDFGRGDLLAWSWILFWAVLWGHAGMKAASHRILRTFAGW